MNNKLKIYTDGGSRGNPGPAALGVYIEDEDGQEIASINQRLGTTTNNIAEYQAVLSAYQWLTSNISLVQTVSFYLDSLLVCSQLKGVYKIKNDSLREIYLLIKRLEFDLNKRGVKITYQHIPRSLNKKADRLVNLALDSV